MKRFRMLGAAGLIFVSAAAFAQNVRVTGTVTDAMGNPLTGVAVYVEGTSEVSLTSPEGEYAVTVPKDAVLTFSLLGYQVEQVEVDGRTEIDVVLQEEAEFLEETIVVAYGTVRKASFTGAASTVDKEQLEKRQVSNLSNALQGAVSGVQTTSSSGTPGSSASIIIRGIGSINGSNPLIVVDGVPYSGSLNSIPTQDIESMTVLKDAAANAMYGARGANGVIIITTKGGKSGKAKVNFEARWGANSRGVPAYDVITDAGEYYEMQYEAYRNSLIPEQGYAAASQYAAENLISRNLYYNKFKGVADNAIIDPTTGKLTEAARNASYKWDDDWLKDPFRKGLRQEYNVNVSGGTPTTQAYLSLGYLSDEGYVIGSGFDRVAARIKADQKIGRHVKAGGNVAYANTVMNRFSSNVSSNYSNLFMFAQTIAPIYPIYLYDEDGNVMKDAKGRDLYDFGDTMERPYGTNSNPYAQAKESIYKNIVDNISTRGYLEAKFLKDFTFTANIAYDVFNTNGTRYTTPIGGDAMTVGGRGYKETDGYKVLDISQILKWNRKFGPHEVSALLVHETNNEKYNVLVGHMTQYAYEHNPEFSNAAQYQDLTSYTGEYALETYIAQGEYSYADRYYATASIRRDGSSRFASGHRWGSFWALGASWRMKEEDFLKPVRWVDNLKLKASYGTNGNDEMSDFPHYYTDLYSVDRVDGDPAFSKVNRGNPEITWEKTNNFNLGVEAGFLDRINVNLDFFIKETKDMLYASPLAPSEGNPAYIYRNEMDMRNTGVEFEVKADAIKTNDIKWNITLNATHYKNELTRLPASKPADEFPNGYAAGNYWRKIGGSYYDWYTYDYEGVNPETGKPVFYKWSFEKDANGKETSVYAPERDKDGNIVEYNQYSDAGQYITGKSAIPDLTGGISTSVEAYGFDFSVQTSFQLGGYVMDSFYSALMSSGGTGSNYHRDMFRRWTPTHTDTDIPALNYENQNASPQGTFYLTKASYFSVNNITLGYSLPGSLIKRFNIEKLRVYIAGDNVWLKSARKGLDPRQSFSGSTGYIYSQLSTWSFGINLTF